MPVRVQPMQQEVSAIGTLLPRAARFTGHWLSAAEAMLSGPLQVAVVGDGPELLALARRAAPGGAVVVPAEPEAPDVPLATGRGLVDGLPAAYVCRGFVCDRPVTTLDELDTLLRSG